MKHLSAVIHVEIHLPDDAEMHPLAGVMRQLEWLNLMLVDDVMSEVINQQPSGGIQKRGGNAPELPKSCHVVMEWTQDRIENGQPVSDLNVPGLQPTTLELEAYYGYQQGDTCLWETNWFNVSLSFDPRTVNSMSAAQEVELKRAVHDAVVSIMTREAGMEIAFSGVYHIPTEKCPKCTGFLDGAGECPHCSKEDE